MVPSVNTWGGACPPPRAFTPACSGRTGNRNGSQKPCSLVLGRLLSHCVPVGKLCFSLDLSVQPLARKVEVLLQLWKSLFK